MTDNGFIEQLLTLLDGRASPIFTESIGVPFKKFLDEIPGGFLIYRADDQQIIYANRAVYGIFGCTTAEEFKALTGNTFSGMVHPDDLAEVEKSIAEQIAASSDNLDYVEYRITDKNGVTRWVEDYGHFVPRENAADVYYVFISDATDKLTRRLAEKTELIHAGKEKDRKLQNLIEEYDKERKLIRQEHLQRLEVIEGLSIPYDSILYADLDADTVLPYRLSSRLERQFDCKLQLRGFSWFVADYVNVWVHPDDRAAVAEQTAPAYIRAKLTESPTYYVNYRCVENNETKYLQLRLARVGDAQVVMGYRNVDVEILQGLKQKQLLEDALKSARLADNAKDAFLSNMSHDMRTPLNAIFGFSAMAKKNVSDAHAVERYLDRIEEAGQQIFDLVERVLELSYHRSRQVNEADCDVIDVLHAVCETLRTQAERKQLDFSIQTSAVTHRAVQTDKEKLSRVLYHVILNAVQYTPAGGAVRVAAVEQKHPSDAFATYCFTVEDNGVGIEPAALENIFEPFVRVNGTTASGVYGTGLGLTIAKRTAETLGGRIDVQSRAGQGSTFTVTVGLRLRDERAQTVAADAAYFSGLKILVVEDNEINLEIETDILEDAGFAVDTAHNGKIAVEKVRNAAPDEYALVLMDIQMPVMDGRSAAREIRKLSDPQRAGVPIVALSANAFESDRQSSLEAGMNAHLSKPIDVARLLDTIASLMQKKRI